MTAYLLRFDPRQILVVAGGCTLLLLALLFHKILAPQYHRLASITDEKQVLEREISMNQTVEAQIALMSRRVAASRQKMRGDEQLMSPKFMQSYVIDKLQHISWARHVELVGVKPGGTAPVIQFDEISFDVTLAGLYEDLYAWLGELKRHMGFMMVKRYEVAPQPTSGRSDRLQMQMTLVFYRKRE